MLIPIWRGRTDEDRDIELRKEANIALFHERHEDLKAELEAQNIKGLIISINSLY